MTNQVLPPPPWEVVVNTFNPSTSEAEVADLRVWGQPGLQIEFQDRQGYTEKPYLEKQSFSSSAIVY